MQDWPQVADALQKSGISCDPGSPPQGVSGGDISAAWRLPTRDGPVFLKSGQLDAAEMFDAERAALAELDAADAVRVPRPLALISTAGAAVLALEWLDIRAADSDANRLFGQQLAALHAHTRPSFGWDRDNTIGATPQSNRPCDDWVEFFRRERLEFQLELAALNGYRELKAEGERVAARLENLFRDYRPPASLLHGDLWGGNWGIADGVPVMFDPALYYGDRETDIAMTRLFGGFSSEFYSAYEEAWPLAPGHEARTDLYQLYHVLNHLNLFGAAYLGRARDLLRGLIAIA
ncbi:MAG: fructosamine kinase family protein [Woeseia sp.]